VEEYDDFDGPSLLKKTLGLQNTHHSLYLGANGAIEPALVRRLSQSAETRVKLPLTSGTKSTTTLRRVDDDHAFLLLADANTQSYEDELKELDAIEEAVLPHGKALIDLYFRIVFPSFPILHKEVFLEKYARSYREFSPPCLAAVYLLALQYWAYDDRLSGRHRSMSNCDDDDDGDDDHDSNKTKPDERRLEVLARNSLRDTIHRPKLSTVQAGLLLLQYNTETGHGNSAELMAQVTSVAHTLGLHLDASDWNIPSWEKGLRKRMAWALYMQDKWSILSSGHPSLIHSVDWTVQPLTDADFPENAAHEDDQEGSSEVEKGKALFHCMISLTQILAELQDRLFTAQARREITRVGDDQQRLNLILEKAKPVQLKLREWFTTLPDYLSTMEVTHIMKLSSVGYLRLAYIAVEITLHRRILLALSSYTDPQLTRICRSVARERFLFALNFVQALKPQHLSSFWYFASAQNLALIGLFGTLLLSLASTAEAYGEEQEKEKEMETTFYREKLREYRWMLKMHGENGARFMTTAITRLDANLQLFEEGRVERGAALD